MALERLDPAVVEAAQTRLRLVRAYETAQRVATEHNGDIARALGLPREFLFRGMRFRVASVPYRAGLALHELNHQLAAMTARQQAQQATGVPAHEIETPDDLRALLAIAEATAMMAWRLARPVSWAYRLVYRWLPNPFVSATQTEVAELLGFFYWSRISSRFAASTSAPLDAPPSPSTTPTS